MLRILLGLSLGRMQLPWALTSLIQTSGVPPEGGGHASEPASARDAGGSMRRDAGTSDIARILIVKARSAAGRPRVAKPNAAKPRKSKPNTPRPNTRAVNKPSRRRKPPRAWKLRPRVVTRQKIFSLPVCDRPGCHEPPQTSVRNAACYCSRACRQAVRNVLDRERKWKSRGTLDGRKKRAYEYQAARQRRRSSAGAAAGPPS